MTDLIMKYRNLWGTFGRGVAIYNDACSCSIICTLSINVIYYFIERKGCFIIAYSVNTEKYYLGQGGQYMYAPMRY